MNFLIYNKYVESPSPQFSFTADFCEFLIRNENFQGRKGSLPQKRTVRIRLNPASPGGQKENGSERHKKRKELTCGEKFLPYICVRTGA